jgi:uncharacterized membrane-anchored protein
MMTLRFRLILGILIPILALSTLAIYKATVSSTGREVKLPIEGYDPRDLLAGHYLVYRIRYDAYNECLAPGELIEGVRSYICLEPRFFSLTTPMSCSMFISGTCEQGRFVAGLERFYVPQEAAPRLEQVIQNRRAEILISVSSNGSAVVKDLLIDDVTWREAIKQAPTLTATPSPTGP